MPKISFCEDLGAPLLGVIMNHEWWNQNQSEILAWLKQNGSVHSNMLVFFPTDEVKCAFLLRWQHG